MTNEDFDRLKQGDIVEYSIFKNVHYVSCDENTVTLKDRSGYKKRVYKELFIKHGKINKSDCQSKRSKQQDQVS